MSTKCAISSSFRLENGTNNVPSNSFSNVSSNADSSLENNVDTKSIFIKLKSVHLPDLKSLHEDCLWITSKLNIASKRELQSSETRLLQFVSVVAGTIKQIEDLNDSNSGSREWRRLVHSIDSKITKTILPVRTRLLSQIEDKTLRKNEVTVDNSDATSTDTNESSFETVNSSEDTSHVHTVSGLKRNRLGDMDQRTNNLGNASVSSLAESEKSNSSTSEVKYGSVLNDSHSSVKIERKNLPKDEKSNKPRDCVSSDQLDLSAHSISQSLPLHTGAGASTVYYSSATDPTINGSFQTLIPTEEDFALSKRRRRLSQIVPNPRKPRQAEYICSVCTDPYSCVVQENPWWAVYHHECPKCHVIQVPRIDIGLSSNAVESDPNVSALYGEGMDDSGEEPDDSDCGSDGDENEDAEGEDRDGNQDGKDEDELEDDKPFDGEGLLAQEEASKLLVLMCHARTCSGYHSSPKHAEICRSTKFLMLHIRDCTGRDVHARECKFPWCLPCKKMLRHLTRCYDPTTCAVCNPWSLPESYQQLRSLNQMRCMPVS